MKCFACGKPEKVPEYMHWIAKPGRNDDWVLWAITPCCSKPAHTEPVATFSGYLHNAEQNARDAARRHNMEGNLVRELVMRSELAYGLIVRPFAEGTKKDPYSTIRRYVALQLRKALDGFADRKPKRRRPNTLVAS